MDGLRQNQLIVEQFTRQAIPFAEMPAHSHEAANELVLQMAEIKPTDTVLDVACGPGLITCEVARRARAVTGIDITPAMIEQAEKRQQKLGLANLVWKIGDVLPLPFEDASFDCVLTRYSFHHFLDPAAVFREMVRACRPGGMVCVIDVFTTSDAQAARYDAVEKLRDPSHVRALRLAELTTLFDEAGLQAVQTGFYRLEVHLETLLASSFPSPGDADRVRAIFRADVGVNELGVNATERDGQIEFSFPIVVIAGRLSCHEAL